MLVLLLLTARALTPLGSESRTSCRDLVVLVNQAPEPIPTPNAVGDRDNARCWWGSAVETARRTKLKASMRSLIVVVPHILAEDPLRMVSAPDQHPIQTLPPNRLHPALGDRVGIRRLDGRRDDLRAVGGEHVVEPARELGVVVAEQKPD